jgi:hypothetical protein
VERAAELISDIRRHDEALIAAAGWVPWTTPFPVLTSRARGWTCRLCMAREGLCAEDAREVFASEAEVAEHLLELHGRGDP